MGPPLAALMVPSTDQSTLMTAGSMTLTFSIAGFVTAPAGGSTESYGCTTTRQMSMMIFSRVTGLYDVFGSLPNSWFIVEFELDLEVALPSHAKKPCIPVPGIWL